MWEQGDAGEVWEGADIAQMSAIYEPLANSVRSLVDATIRSEADAQTVAEVRSDIDAAVERLRRHQIDGAFGERQNDTGNLVNLGNAVRGLRNALAPPVLTHHDESGRVWAEFHLGAAYEGPGGHVHGGVSALILDQLLGEAACLDRKPRFTGTISYRYVRPAPLGTLRAEAIRTRTDGAKTMCAGTIADMDGNVLVEAEGVFITPRWLRD